MFFCDLAFFIEHEVRPVLACIRISFLFLSSEAFIQDRRNTVSQTKEKKKERKEGFPSFLRPNNIPLSVYSTFLFVHSSADGHVAHLHLLTSVGSAAVNMGGQIPAPIPAVSSFVSLPRSGTAGPRWFCV